MIPSLSWSFVRGVRRRTEGYCDGRATPDLGRKTLPARRSDAFSAALSRWAVLSTGHRPAGVTGAPDSVAFGDRVEGKHLLRSPELAFRR
jgi:hypothetical protein